MKREIARPNRALRAEPALTPAGRAANTSLRMALVSLLAFALGLISLMLPFGVWSFLLGVVIWLALWTISIGMAIGALRNAYSDRQPRRVRQRAAVALVIDGLNMGVVIGFTVAMVLLVQQL